MKRKLKGSYTIEASLLFPFILMILILIIYFSFFIHDRCIMHAAAYTAALRGSQILNEDEDVFSKVEKSSQELLENRLLAVRNHATDIQISEQEISVLYEGAIRIPVWSFPDIPIKVRGTAKRIDNVKFIRECRIIENAAKK